MNIGKRIEQSIRHSLRRRQLSKHGVTKNQGAAFLVTGGIGDLIVVARFVRDLLSQLGGGEFSIFYSNPSVANAIFCKLPGFQNAYPERFFHYGKDLFSYALKINQVIVIEKWPEFILEYSGSVEQLRLIRILENVDKNSRPLAAIVQHHPYLDGELGRYAAIKGRRRYDFLHYLAGIDYGGHALDILADIDAPNRLGLTPGNYVTIHNGYDENMLAVSAGRRATKAYAHWDDVINSLPVNIRSDFKFVQIGTPATSQDIRGMDLNLVGKTSLAEAYGLVAGSACHLDNEGGFVHVAAAFGTRASVVFGPTPEEYFGYPENINFRPHTCGGCWWVEKSWMRDCPKGLEVPVCMVSHQSESLSLAISSELRARISKTSSGS